VVLYVHNITKMQNELISTHNTTAPLRYTYHVGLNRSKHDRYFYRSLRHPGSTQIHAHINKTIKR